MRAKLINLLMGRANNRKNVAPKRPSRPRFHGVSTHSLWECIKVVRLGILALLLILEDTLLDFHRGV